MLVKDKKSEKALKEPKPTNYLDLYGSKRPPLRLEDQEFRFTLVRPERKKNKRLPLKGVIESIEWRDEGNEFNLNTVPVLRGSMSLRDAKGMYIKDGHIVECDVRWGGEWEPYFAMRIELPRSSPLDGTQTFDLADDLILATRSTGTFSFQKAKNGRKKRGWLYHEIVREVCREYRIPVGKLTRGVKYITIDDKDISPLEMIRLVVEEEIKWTGKKLCIRWAYDKDSKGFALTVIPMRHQPLLYTFKEQIRGAEFSYGHRATIVTSAIGAGTRKVGKGKKRKTEKIKDVSFVSKEGVARYGYIEKKINVGNVESKQQLRHRLKREIAERLKPIRKVENFEHSGIAHVRRGDAVRIEVPSEGFHEKKGVLFVTTVIHTLSSSGDYTMNLSLSFTDLLDPAMLKYEREKAVRNRKRIEKGKEGAGGGGGGYGEQVDGAKAGWPTTATTSVGGYHETAGLSGYPAKDYFAPAGSPCVSPVTGKVTKLSGSAPGAHCTPGGACGYSVYISGGGKSYFLTHIENVSVNVGDSVKQGEKIATLIASPPGTGWSVPHVHMGVNG